MTVAARTPVVVGAATATQRLDDPASAKEALGLMVEACERAAADAGSPDLLRATGQVLVPKGSWRYDDAARLVADRLGATGARSLVAEVGVLQTTLFERAASAVARGDLDVALVVGGEAKWRQLRASITGTIVADTQDPGATPDELLKPSSSIISREEIAARLVTAVSHYTLIENARRAADGQSLEEHARSVAEVWARFNAVAQANPDAWNRAPMTADDIRTAGPKNRPLAFPYNKWHNSQWNVDQAACLIVCAAEVARAHGVPEDRWVFPHAIVESNHIVPVSERGAIHRSPGFAIAGSRATQLAGIGIEDVAHVDLYSCFPIAVRVQAAELGLDVSQPLTVTGGMAFGGGPLNNYVLQSMAKMTQVLREDPGSIGLVTAISGMISKQGVSLWSTRPPTAGYCCEDVSVEADAATPRVPSVANAAGDATIATYTVLYDDGKPARAAVVVDLAGGTRSVAVSDDAALMAAMATEEWCGRRVRLDGRGGFAS